MTNSMIKQAKAIHVRGAVFSPCRTWRYQLWRLWGEAGKASNVCAFVGLNPSTADESLDDPTIRRCIRFARDWGHDGYVMLNAYAYRATKPKDMLTAVDPVGPDNDQTLRRLRVSDWVTRVVAAWGSHCSTYRQRQVLTAIGREVECLGLTKDGRPKHPLYLPANAQPVTFWIP